jgi:hypothetical protein
VKTLDVFAAIPEALAAIGRFIQVPSLQDGPHRAVDNDDAFLQEFAKLCFNTHVRGEVWHTQIYKSTYLDALIC